MVGETDYPRELLKKLRSNPRMNWEEFLELEMVIEGIETVMEALRYIAEGGKHTPAEYKGVWILKRQVSPESWEFHSEEQRYGIQGLGRTKNPEALRFINDLLEMRVERIRNTFEDKERYFFPNARGELARHLAYESLRGSLDEEGHTRARSNIYEHVDLGMAKEDLEKALQTV